MDPSQIKLLPHAFPFKQFLIITLLTSIWIHLSEVFRYFVLIRPEIQTFFEGRDNIADMNLGIFAVWGLWDTLLTAIIVGSCWVFAQFLGHGKQLLLTSSTVVWMATFVILWIGIANMGLAPWEILLIALPLSWLELLIGTGIASFFFKKNIGIKVDE